MGKQYVRGASFKIPGVTTKESQERAYEEEKISEKLDKKEIAKKKIDDWQDEYEVIRVDGGAICPDCDQPFRAHLQVVLMCDGKLGKL